MLLFFFPIRVPIFLGPINSYELSVARNNLRMGGLSQVGEGGKHRQRPVDYKDLESPLLVFLISIFCYFCV